MIKNATLTDSTKGKIHSAEPTKTEKRVLRTGLAGNMTEECNETGNLRIL